MKKIGLTGWILIAMLSGIVAGLVIHYNASPASVAGFSSGISLLTDIFLRLIKMIIAPLVFSTLVVGIAKLGDIKAVGRIGGKALLWFISMSFLSVGFGLLMMNILKLGENLKLPLPAANAQTSIAASSLSVRTFIEHVFPTSITQAMSGNEILQIVVFSVFFGVAATAIGEQGKIVVKALDSVAKIILKMTGYVMKVAPIGAFAAIAGVVAIKGSDILYTYGKFIAFYYLSIVLLCVLLTCISSLFIGRRAFRLIDCVKDSVLLAFSTASSEAALPQLMAELEAFGCQNKIVSFVLPLGYSFNMDGGMMYLSFSSLFIVQAYGIHMSLAQQIFMLLVLMLTSKGIAGVPRGSLVVLAGSLSMFNIPQQGLLLLLGIDQILDMARSATNVVGNSLATAVVSKMEGSLSNGLPIDKVII
jgi:Na+/H+-dicarboxylate symporter